MTLFNFVPAGRFGKPCKPLRWASHQIDMRLPRLVLILLIAVTAQAQRVPLTDMGSTTYLGFGGGLYLDGSNDPPLDHAAAGAAHARLVQPLDKGGLPDSAGKIALLSIGMSNTTQEFCSGSGEPPCDPWSFVGQALADPAVNKKTLVFVNGARGGQAAATWDSPTERNYDRVRDTDLRRLDLTEAQVQVAWVKVANPGPTRSLPASNSDAYTLVSQMGNIVRALTVRYPNLRLVFLSSRIYAGYATTTLNPEPYAYESGFAVKWLIEAQIHQMRNGGNAIDQRAGNLNYNTIAPWIGWGAYLWADGMNPRSDGVIWERRDLSGDGTHPSQAGREKVGRLLLQFFRNDSLAGDWFLAGSASGRRRLVRP